ncbi:MAG: amino acid racemase [Rhodospirillaceae bacterium]|nr:amino acid racemase [Rhodospirillaceae bacterium]
MAAQHIGIVACSAEGAALCYRTICAEGAVLLGGHAHPEISMHTYPLEAYMAHIRTGNWQGVAQLMVRSAHKLAQCGAQFAICPDNTVHEAFGRVIEASPIPWLHIADTVAAAARRQGFGKLGITGTKYLTTGTVYPAALDRYRLEHAIPDAAARERIDDIIFNELVHGVFLEASRQFFNQVFEDLRDRGCDAVVLGCTEIPLLIDPTDTALPTLDSTRLLARAALQRSVSRTADPAEAPTRPRRPPPP